MHQAVVGVIEQRVMQRQPVVPYRQIVGLPFVAVVEFGELGALMRIRSTPRLQFYYDESIEYGARMDALINSAIDSDKKHGHENENENEK